MIIPICIAIGHVADFMLVLFYNTIILFSLDSGTKRNGMRYNSRCLTVPKWQPAYCCLQPAILLARGSNTAGWRQQ